MSRQLWNYLRSRVQVVTNDGKIIKGRVIDFVDEMDNDEQDEITILIDNPSPDEATEISLFESEVLSIETISQDLEQFRCFYLPYLKENTMEKDLVYMAILDDLQALYDNGWDASFDYNGQVCGIFPLRLTLFLEKMRNFPRLGIMKTLKCLTLSMTLS